MASGREIKTKIKSVQNTRKVTRALEMVSASKIRKAQDRMKTSRPYAQAMKQVIGHLAQASTDFQHPFLVEREDVKRVGYIVISSDRGLAGGLNNNLFRKAVAEMRGAEAMTAQEAARTGHVVVTSLHANSARKAYGRILSMCQMSGTNISTNILMGFVAEAFPVMVFKKQMPDGTRRIMEIVEATGVRDGAVQARTLFRFEEGRFVQTGGISDSLAATLLENGAPVTSVGRFKVVIS